MVPKEKQDVPSTSGKRAIPLRRHNASAVSKAVTAPNKKANPKPASTRSAPEWPRWTEAPVDTKPLSKPPKNTVDADFKILGRETECAQLKKQLSTFLKHENSNILYLTGVPGSGKTYTTLGLLEHNKVPFTYVNCSVLKAKSDIYKRICNSLGCYNGGMGSLYALRSHFAGCTEKHIIVIDEIDFLITKDEAILYNLFEMPFLDECKILMIVISNTLSRLSTRVESRIGKNRIEFKPYTAEQLVSIVNPSSSVDQEPLELIAKRVASTTGDIRKVKELVDTATNELDLKTANQLLRNNNTPLLHRFLKSLSFYQKLVLFHNTQPVKSIFDWFADFKTHCLIKDYPVLDFADFQYVVNDLIKFDIYKMKTDHVHVTCQHLKEEFDQVMRTDDVFKGFKIRGY